jgi:hypothetical protein
MSMTAATATDSSFVTDFATGNFTLGSTACSGALGFAELGFAELGFAELGFAELGFAELGFAELGFAELGFAELVFAALGGVEGMTFAARSAGSDFESSAIAEGNFEGLTDLTATEVVSPP